MKLGASGVQLATRFTVSEECGLPDKVKQAYFRSEEEDVIVDTFSPTGYPMRILKYSPAFTNAVRPNCERLGYLLNKGKCSYIDAYEAALAKNGNSAKNLIVTDKVCLCTHMWLFKLWTCGHNVYRLKDTTNRLGDNLYQTPSAEHILRDYLYSEDYDVSKPILPVETPQPKLSVQ